MSAAMAEVGNLRKSTKKVQQNQNYPPPKAEKPPSWSVVRGLLSCRYLQPHQQQPLQMARKEQQKLKPDKPVEENGKKCKKIKWSSSLCSNTKITQRPDQTGFPQVHEKRTSFSVGKDEYSSSRSMKAPLRELNGVVISTSYLSASSNSSNGTSSRSGKSFRKFYGCYECKMVVNPVLGIIREPSLRPSIFPCPECGEIFIKSESLELHQSTSHAVSELGAEDTSRNIVEIIFQSSWLKKQAPICKIDRILKVHNTQKTISRFEEYRDAIKAKSAKLPKKYPRCIADGNELLRFHSTTVACALGENGSSNLCNAITDCKVCGIIKNGFKVSTGEQPGKGVLTTATSGKAHDSAGDCPDGGGRRAMLVCRVIAGRVRRGSEMSSEEYDSVGGAVEVYSNLEELRVFNPNAILPCFVVIYGGF